MQQETRQNSENWKTNYLAFTPPVMGCEENNEIKNGLKAAARGA